MMKMSVFDADAAQRVGTVLSKFLYYLRGSFEVEVDLSPYAVKKKRRDEVQSLSSSTQSLGERIQNYSKRASVSSSPRERDVLGNEQKGQKNTVGVDLSALAAAKKYSNELAELSTRMNFEDKMEKYNKKTDRDKMYFTSGNVATTGSGKGRNWEFKSREVKKVSTTDRSYTDESFIDVDGVFDPQHLDGKAMASLRQLLHAQLNTHDSSEEQVSDVLDYSMDMVSSESNIGTVIKEVSVNFSSHMQALFYCISVLNEISRLSSSFYRWICAMQMWQTS